MGFEQGLIDPCLFFLKEVVVVVYVDDCLIFTPSFNGLFCVLWVLLGGVLRCEQLPFASQVVRLEVVQHRANMSQTQCD